MIALELKMHGIEKVRARLAPGRFQRALMRGVNRGTEHLLKDAKAQSRVDSGDYRRDWRKKRLGLTRWQIYNEDSGEYAEFVSGRTQSSRPGGRARGAGEKFMRKLRRDNLKTFRQIVLDELRKELT